MRVTPVYTSVGVNRSSSCAACSSTGIVAFGAGSLVALWDTKDDRSRGVHAALPGHRGLVTTVKLVSLNGKEGFVSGDTSGEVRVWQLSLTSGSYTCRMMIPAHPSSISALGIPPSGPLSSHIFTGSSDASIKMWRLEKKEAQLVQEFDMKGKLPLDIAVGYLPVSDAPVVIIGCTDRRIQIWTREGERFSISITLEGHGDWVRCLALTAYPSIIGASTDLLFASGSQDNYIRLWRISRASHVKTNIDADGGLDMLDEFERKLAGEGGNRQISTKTHVLAVNHRGTSSRYDVTLEALLLGHEAGLTNIRWSQPSSNFPNPVLLSTASDNSLVIWAPSSQGIWIPEHRFGSLCGRGLAFYGAIWGTGGNSVMAGGWNGGWERWIRNEQGSWDAKNGISGHAREVKSICWDERGDYLLSVSSDQTSRIHGCALTEPSDPGPSTWAEIARPQIHGYDLADAAFIAPLRFASAADEKVARVFDAPSGFVESLWSLGIVEEGELRDTASRPKGATVPPLGLSNKALGKEPEVESSRSLNHHSHEARHSVSRTLTALPTEEELATSTLWPEAEKVYGHGYELAALAASHDGSMIASACRASNPDHAVVRVHSTSTWEPIGLPLTGHTLTITTIAFSPEDSTILTCSRDRSWRLFRRKKDGSGYVPLVGEEKAHARMVLDGCWSPRGDVFATASRDKTVKIWSSSPDQEKWSPVITTKLNEAASSVDMTSVDGMTLLAIGTESGSIEIHTLYAASSQLAFKFDPGISHVGAVNRLAWRPAKQGRELDLASCSDDRSVRIYRIDM